MIRAVLDTVTFVAGLRSPLGASHALLMLIPQRRFQLIASPEMFLELEQVLKRREHRLVHGLSTDDVDAFLVDLARYIEPARYYRWRPQLSDEQDEMILDAAVNGRADYIVTFNLKDFAPVKQRFGIEVVTPAQFLKEVSK